MGGICIACVDPTEYASEIKRLFAENDRPGFDEYFDRLYPGAASEGARSWVGLDGGGRVVMHVSGLPHRMLYGDLEVRAWIVGNIMVAQRHRGFFPARALFQRMAADAFLSGTTDLLYTETTTAANVMAAAGFQAVCGLGRYVLPVSAPGAVVDAGLKVMQAALRRTKGPRRLTVDLPCATEFDETALMKPPPRDDELQGVHSPALYRRRLSGYPGPGYRWVVVREPGAEAPLAAALLREPPQGGLASLLKIHCSPGITIRRAVADMIPAFRRLGYPRVQASAVAESRLGKALAHSGFLRRETLPVVGLALTKLGTTLIRTPRAWRIGPLDLDI